MRERSFSWFRERKNKFCTDTPKQGDHFSAISKILQLPEAIEHESIKGTNTKTTITKTTITTTTTVTDLDSQQLQGVDEQKQAEQEHFTFHEHSFLGFGFGKETTIDDRHVRALFAPETEGKDYKYSVDKNNEDVKALVSAYADKEIEKFKRKS